MWVKEGRVWGDREGREGRAWRDRRGMGGPGGESVGEDSATSEPESRNNVKVTGSDLSSDDDSD